jgi:aspartokinase/homoserine dehydrogenase 1
MHSPSYTVMKFGGSSLGNSERLLRVLKLVQRERLKGPLALVVSAMGDTTDWLIEAVQTAASGSHEASELVLDRIAELATGNGLMAIQQIEEERGGLAEKVEILSLVRETITPLRRLLYGVSLVREVTPQTLDLVMSFGERLSAQVFSALLNAMGEPALYLDARTWTITDDTFGNAVVLWDQTQAKLDELRPQWGDRIPVCTGFLGSTRDGRTTTLGRNGSDYTATLLARGLQAVEVTRWTDVSGVMTADPDIVQDAYPLSRLSYMEALELANFGAKVFHPRTMIPLIESGIPMRIRNTMNPEDEGTVVDAHGAQDYDYPTSVTSLEKLAMISLQWLRVSISQQAALGERVLHALEVAGVTVWMATQSAHGQAVAVVVPLAQLALATDCIERDLRVELDRGELQPIGIRRPVTLITLVCEAMGTQTNVAGRFFHSLGRIGVNIQAIAQGASTRSISAVIDAADTTVAVRTVHAAFNLAHQQVSIMVMGTGTVGTQLLSQIEQQAQKLEESHGIVLRVVGVMNSRRVVFDPNGLSLDGVVERLQSAPEYTPVQMDGILGELRRLPLPILVDCTAAAGMIEFYASCIERGLHVVGANKKPLTVPMDAIQNLRGLMRRHSRAWYYETTVGASLPVIETLKDLVRTGDQVRLIEGAFSGTLGYLANELMAGARLSAAVEDARHRGYTEPNPGDDLCGLDVARKALILARELGLALELSDVIVEPFVPRQGLEQLPVDELMAVLRSMDDEMHTQILQLKSEGRTLRYLARIDLNAAGGPKVTVGPVAVPNDHPAADLRGAEAFVAYTTERYSQYPLIVRGAGAGGAVTAAGVLADILRVALGVRGG